ncbi:MAG: RagB/SusD family nutrient uptake outer membrane protein [Muribaculaceae bacterium]|nr:RagB/SusD family nutrient uptake outer membrane protein [Muribaculaceae bacterium]
MKYINKIATVVALSALSMSCSDVIDPAFEPSKDADQMIDYANYADQLLYTGYIMLPYTSNVESDMATDDAVCNDNSNAYLQLATGSWTSNNGTLSIWKNGRGSIQFINELLTKVDLVNFSDDEKKNALFAQRLKGEALGLRALYMFHLLRNHGGYVQGELLGVPNLLEPENAQSDFNQPRATFRACMEQLFADADEAARLLPDFYGNVTSESEIPAKYKALGLSTDEYNDVMGVNMPGRMSALIANAISAQAALMAASPAFAEGSGVTWADAADRAAKVLDTKGGVAAMAPKGHLWYEAGEVAGNISFNNPAEVMWRANMASNRDLEQEYFAPSLRGKGRVNPTQNLVDAFPMANGYPIAEAASGYDKNNPYAGRDPRLSAYIVYNGSTAGHNNSTIVTATYGTNNDRLNAEQGYSTRTGYYMRKLVRNDVNCDPSVEDNKDHIPVRMRYTEFYLAYAEAANEAYGPTNGGNHGYSAYDVIKAIRSRAGLGVDGVDAYLESVKGNKDAMRELIRNERRIELCFEGKRFWDLRRWKADLTESARGMRISGSEAAPVYEVFDVENRKFDSYMTYGPIPYGETVKFNNLLQNDGWK